MEKYLDNILKDVDPQIVLDEDQRKVILTDEDYCLVIAGAGVRALGWAKGIIDRCQGHSELVALYDINGKRMEGFCALINKQIPSYTDFEKMLRETKPTVLLICTPDYTHPDLVDMGFAAGLDIVTEKPMGMSRDAIHRILAAEKKYNKKDTVRCLFCCLPTLHIFLEFCCICFF